MVLYLDGKFRKLVNPLAYTLRACYGWSGVYLDYFLSDKRTVIGHWASYTVFKEFFNRRSRIWRGTPIKEY